MSFPARLEIPDAVLDIARMLERGGPSKRGAWAAPCVTRCSAIRTRC